MACIVYLAHMYLAKLYVILYYITLLCLKLAELEEKLITLGTKYMECSDEKAKLSRQLESLKLDYQAISHQKYFVSAFII